VKGQIMRYPVAIETGTDTAAFGVVVPDLPGCCSAGDTRDDALNITLPRRVLKRLDARARSAGESRSGSIAYLTLR
jgi:hypothetical protein